MSSNNSKAKNKDRRSIFFKIDQFFKTLSTSWCLRVLFADRYIMHKLAQFYSADYTVEKGLINEMAYPRQFAGWKIHLTIKEMKHERKCLYFSSGIEDQYKITHSSHEQYVLATVFVWLECWKTVCFCFYTVFVNRHTEVVLRNKIFVPSIILCKKQLFPESYPGMTLVHSETYLGMTLLYFRHLSRKSNFSSGHF